MTLKVEHPQLYRFVKNWYGYKIKSDYWGIAKDDMDTCSLHLCIGWGFIKFLIVALLISLVTIGLSFFAVNFLLYGELIRDTLVTSDLTFDAVIFNLSLMLGFIATIFGTAVVVAGVGMAAVMLVMYSVKHMLCKIKDIRGAVSPKPTIIATWYDAFKNKYCTKIDIE